MVTEAVSYAKMHLTTARWRNASLQQDAMAIFIDAIHHSLNDRVWFRLIACGQEDERDTKW